MYMCQMQLAGETVYAQITGDQASVTAVFEFDRWWTRDAKIVYFPIFANDFSDPIQVLSQARLEFEVGGKKLGLATPCEAPSRFNKISGGAKVFWFSADLDKLVDDSDINTDGRIVIRVSYAQSIIRNRFYYLPIIVGPTDEKTPRRMWNYQMIVRSTLRVPRVLSKETDYEQMGDCVIAYLKHGKIVEVQ